MYMLPLINMNVLNKINWKNQIKTVPDESRLTPIGAFNAAVVASPLSPLYPPLPVPAIVLIIPVAIVTLRIQELPASAMYKLPNTREEINNDDN